MTPAEIKAFNRKYRAKTNDTYTVKKKGIVKYKKKKRG